MWLKSQFNITNNDVKLIISLNILPYNDILLFPRGRMKCCHDKPVRMKKYLRDLRPYERIYFARCGQSLE